MPPTKIRTYMEIGTKRVFAGAIEWPGWCRAGRDQDSALETLFEYGTRYATTLRSTRVGFEPAAGPAPFAVVERLKGNATTDFGAPSIAPKADERRITGAELERLRTILHACWRSFDSAVDAARGKELAKGPRGGGRDLPKIVDHVVDADGSYLRMVARKVEAGTKSERLDRTRAAVLDALATTAREGVPPPGPRGGKRWLPRYFVRRVAWHALDHAWEIEDRIHPTRPEGTVEG
jgi:hypothetical protein